MNRWFRLAAAVVAMIMIANLQYCLDPVRQAAHSGQSLEALRGPVGVYVLHRGRDLVYAMFGLDGRPIGPRLYVTIAGLLCGLGWATLGWVHSLPALYFFYTVAGLGAAMVYCGSEGLGSNGFPINADWPPVSSPPVLAPARRSSFRHRAYSASPNYNTAFLYTGIGQGSLIVVAAQFLENPALGEAPAAKPTTKVAVRNQTESFNSLEMLQTPHFYVLFMMMLMMGIGGLMVTAQVAPLADTF